MTAIFVKGKGVVYETLIDTNDFEIVNSVSTSWYCEIGKYTNYVKTTISKGGKRKGVLLHRLIMNPPLHLVVDHINHNGTDNRRCNLRTITQSGNAQNQIKARTDSKSGVRGVIWHKTRGKWMVYLYLDKKYKHFGFFDDLDKAKSVAELARAEYMPYSQEAITKEVSESNKVRVPNAIENKSYRCIY